ncbi:MAG: PD-(D/E)XK nuclease family protein [Phormidesmis sp.]
MLPLSQGHLTRLSTCPRKFKYVFFDALSSPSSYEQAAKTQWGSQFHLLMQQRALALPVEVMSAADEEMTRRLSALASAAPEVFEYLSAISNAADLGDDLAVSGHDVFAQSEQRRTLAFNDYLLTVIYDLVVETPDSGQIFDWKTHQQPPRKEWLQTDWQTRLYLYVLCETTELAPEQISMTYCFVRLGSEAEAVTNGDSKSRNSKNGEGKAPIDASAEANSLPANSRPSFYRFGYSAAQHQKTKQDLQQLTDKLTQGIACLNTPQSEVAFPKVERAKGLCDACSFNIRCDRASSAISPTQQADNPYQLLRAAKQITVETVPEIPI